jgi:hypothetical protein
MIFATSGVDLAQSATEASSNFEKASEGGASIILLSIAAASMYALIQGKIVPVSAFREQLNGIETRVSENSAIAATVSLESKTTATTLLQMERTLARIELSLHDQGHA